MFFENEDNAKILGNFIRKADAAHIEDESRATRLLISRQIIGYIYKSPEGWDERCTFNIKHVGQQYLQWLSEFDSSKMEDIDHIYILTYRFLCEFDFLVGSGRELSMELRSLRDRIIDDSAEMDDSCRSQIIYASYVMPASIAKDFINDSNIGVFKDFEQKKIEAEKLKEKWDEEISSKEAATDALKNKLEKYKVAFNFVGLYQGFSDLAKKKVDEAVWLFWSLIGMGLLILTPLATEIFLSAFGVYEGNAFGIDHLLIVIPIISIEIILIYFFKVILVNYRSVKAQIMQIELRQTLCQFIQSYVDYSSEMKKNDSTALEKFESLIFSGVLSDPEKLPSTFDGLEQIGNLIKSLKNP